MHKPPLNLNTTIYPHTTYQAKHNQRHKAFPCAQPNTTIYMPPPKFKLPFAKKPKKNSRYLIAQTKNPFKKNE
jgi:hypothetical protein